ncbi:MAG: hypothetical protein WAW03_07510, partial [Anaerolineae bacterium]
CGQTPLRALISETPAPPVVMKTVAVPVVTEKAPSVPDEPPPPQVCDLQNPTLFSILIYDNDPQKVLSRYLPQAVSYEVTYKNPITGQVFRMTGTGLDAGVTMAYLSSLRVCFEAIETTKGFETDPWDALGLDQILFEEVGKATSRQPDELAQYNTLADAITSKGGDVVKVRTDAIQRAGEAVNQASADAKLTDQQAKEIAAALEPAYKDALDAEGLPAWFVEPKDEAQILIQNKQNLIVEMEWLPSGETSGKSFVVYYVIDPSINKNQVINFKMKCQQSARVRIRADAGRMTVGYWGYTPGYQYIGNRTASVSSTPYPPAMSCCTWAPAASRYDVKVTGGQDHSRYVIEGGWVVGPNSCG